MLSDNDFLRKLGDSNPRYDKLVRQFSKLLVSATHPNFLPGIFTLPLHLLSNAMQR